MQGDIQHPTRPWSAQLEATGSGDLNEVSDLDTEQLEAGYSLHSPLQRLHFKGRMTQRRVALSREGLKWNARKLEQTTMLVRR